MEDLNNMNNFDDVCDISKSMKIGEILEVGVSLNTTFDG